ncbi:MAG TPA: hypothetical protein VJQ45_08075 [Ktedonobacterales bacterium]|nr:hypothetical protein [Ktedonobacterales bacterium]
MADIENLRKLREEIDRSVQSLRGLLERLPIVPAVPYQAHPSDGWLAAQVTTDEEDQA